jgi:poly(3-hydroxybutyrate) depolymerase
VVLFDLSNMTPTSTTNWEKLADQDHFAFVYLPNIASGGYNTPVIIPNYKSIAPVNVCGPSGTSPCNDAPYVNGVLNKVIPQQNINTSRIYATGGSKGGMMTEEVMCDSAMSSRFAGFAPVSAVFISPSASSNVPPNCPALSTHKNFAVQWQYGTSDRAYGGNMTTGFVSASGRWDFSQGQNQTLITNPKLGCNTVKTSYSGTGSMITTSTYTGCLSPRAATSVVMVTGGGHEWQGLDGVHGFSSAATAYSFWNNFATTIAPSPKPTSTPGPTPTATPSAKPTETPNPTSSPTPAPSTLNTLARILYDMAGPYEGPLHGIPSAFGWATHPTVFHPTDSLNMPAETAWGQIYADANANEPSNVRIELRNMASYYLSKSQHKWIRLQDTVPVSGAHYVENFAQNAHIPASWRLEPDGGNSSAMISGYNLHFWPQGARGLIANPSDVAAFYSTYQARLIIDNPSGPNNLPKAKYLANAGGDWWGSVSGTCVTATNSCNPGIGEGRFTYLTPQWTAVDFYSGGPYGASVSGAVTAAQLSANPPPLS